MNEPTQEMNSQLYLITRNLAEVVDLERLTTKLREKGTLHIYWGTAPTKAPHLGYFLPLLKIRDLIKAGCKVTILLADIHSYLDEGFSSISKVEARTEFYKFVITEMLRRIGVNPEEYEIVKGSEVQLNPKYFVDLLKFTTIINEKSALKAGTEVVKKTDTKNVKISSLIYPLMQCLDETALEVDAQLGGVDQRKIFGFSRDHVEKLGKDYSKCSYLINPLLPSLCQSHGVPKLEKMSASIEKSKITFLDNINQIHKKICNAYCPPNISDVNSNAILALLKYIIFPMCEAGVFENVVVKTSRVRNESTHESESKGEREDSNEKKEENLCKSVVVESANDMIVHLTYTDFKELEQDWIDGQFNSMDLKICLSRYVNVAVSPVREKIQLNRWIYENAYE